MKKVMVFGTFDLLHPGHVHMLKEAKSYGDYLIVVIGLDKTVQKIKGKLPKHSEQERLQNLQKLKLADKVILGNVSDKFKVIEDEQPNVIALGYDQKVLIENFTERLGKNIKVVRLTSFKPEVYKSSKISDHLVSL